MKKILAIVLAVMMIVSTVAISGIVTASAATPVQTVDLIPAYGNKNLDYVSHTVSAGEGVDEISIVDSSTLTGGTAGVPSDTAYFFTNNSAASRAGMYFDLPVKIFPVLSELMSYQTIYIDMWVWAEAKWGTPNIRLTETKVNFNGSYVEYNIYDSGNFTVNAGWNHVTVSMKLGNNAGRTINKFAAIYESMSEGWMPDISIYNHAAADIDYAVAAVRLMTTSSPNETWDLDVTTDKSHYYIGESVSKDDLTVTYKGEEVTDYTFTALDTTTAGRKTFVVTYGEESATYTIQVKPRGDSVYDWSAECYTGMPPSGNGLGITAGINQDNFRGGNQTITYDSARTNPDTQLHLLEPMDLTGEEYLQAWVYMNEAAVNPSANYEFLIEISSADSPTKNCIRYHWTGNGNAGRGKISNTFNVGWNLINIPLTNDTATKGDFAADLVTSDSVTTVDKSLVFLDDVRVIWVHSSQTQRTVDLSKVNYIRVRTPSIQNTTDAIILVGGIGYGMDTAVNNHKAGNDLVQTFADAKDGDVVSLQNDVTVDETIVIDKNVTLDLNRFTLKSSADPIFEIDGGSLTVVDNSQYLVQSYREKRYYGDIVSTTANASAFKMRGAVEQLDETYSYLKVTEKIDIKADYGIDVNPKLKNQGNYNCYGVEADLYANFAPSGLSEDNNCNIYINGLVQGNPVINIYDGVYEVTDVSHFAVPGEGTINVKGGSFSDALLAAGTTTTAEVKTDVYIFDKYTDNVEGLIIVGGVWDVDVSNAKAIEGGVFLNDSYKAVAEFELTETDANDAAVLYAGNWATLNNQKNANNKNLIRASKSGSTAKFNFTGRVLEISGYKSPTYGKIGVEIVGQGYYEVDLYAETATWDAHLFTIDLTNEQTRDVIITVLDEKNEAASRPGLFYAALDTISTDGTINAVSETVVETDIVVTEKTTEITVEDVFANGAEITGLTNVVAQNGSVEVNGNVITYTAGVAATDVITYTINGVQGKINVTVDMVFEAEDILNKGTNMYSWYFSGRNATILKAGETASFDFSGTELTLIGYTSLSYGDFELWVDGELVATISENAEGYNYQYGLGRYTFDEGIHEVEIVALGKTLIDSVVVK